MGKPAVDNYVGHRDGFAVVEGQEENGIIAANCPHCEDAHLMIRQGSSNLQFLKAPCSTGFYVWLGNPDEFDPTDDHFDEPGSDVPTVLEGRIRSEHRVDRIVVSPCPVCDADEHLHGRAGAEHGDIVLRTPHCGLPQDELPKQIAIRIEGEEDE